jgi:hypothetical protein
LEETFKNLPKFQNQWFAIWTMIDEWARSFDVPREEIVRQLSWAHGWILSNPKKAPKKDMVRFLFNWMRKAHQMGTLKKHRAPEKLHHDMPREEPATEEDLRWMHDTKVQALKVCRTPDCRFCPSKAHRPGGPKCVCGLTYQRRRTQRAFLRRVTSRSPWPC